MPSRKTSTATAVMALAATASAARININTWCVNDPVYVVVSKNAGCNTGQNGYCISDGDQPWTIIQGGNSIWWQELEFDSSVSVKISRQSVPQGVLQYEYALVNGEFGGLYWDLSDLDGTGPNLTGSPFRRDNVKVTPTGNGVGANTCNTIFCPKDQICVDSYQHPDDVNTRFCPVNTGDQWVDLCIPDDLMHNKRSLIEARQEVTKPTNGTAGFHQLRIGNDYMRQFSHHTRQKEANLWRGASVKYTPEIEA